MGRTKPLAKYGIQGEVGAPLSSPSPFYKPVNVAPILSKCLECLQHALLLERLGHLDLRKYPTAPDINLSLKERLLLLQCGLHHKEAHPSNEYGRHRFQNKLLADPLQYVDSRRYIFLTYQTSSYSKSFYKGSQTHTFSNRDICLDRLERYRLLHAYKSHPMGNLPHRLGLGSVHTNAANTS